MKRLFILLILTNIASQLNSQIDTLSIKEEINSLVDKTQHINFWKKVYEDDQHNRGKNANDSIDIRNLLKCSYYLNKFGFPKQNELGLNSQVITYVWIHNKFPKTDLLTFPIIMEGYLAKQINESDFRTYFLRSIYSYKYPDPDPDYKEISISDLLQKVKPKIKRPIKIDSLLKTYEIEYNFLYNKHEEIGLWIAPAKFDTLYYENKPIINEITKSPIRIFMANNGKYFYHKLHHDRSHYPQELIKIEKNKFKIMAKSNTYLEILNNDSLKVSLDNGTFEIYATDNNR